MQTLHAKVSEHKSKLCFFVLEEFGRDQFTQREEIATNQSSEAYNLGDNKIQSYLY